MIEEKGRIDEEAPLLINRGLPTLQSVGKSGRGAESPFGSNQNR